MVKVGRYNTMQVLREVSIGVYLDDGKDGILLPSRFVPEGLKKGDEIEVFIYHDSEDRLIATTEKPLGIVGEIVYLKVVSTTSYGAFLDWGLPKDVFVPKSKQRSVMYKDEYYFVLLYIDTVTGRVAATEKFEPFLKNEDIVVREMEEVEVLIHRKTDLGYAVIINNIHAGLLHFNELFKPVKIGERYRAFVKQISEEGKIDVVLGKAGYEKIEDEATQILTLLKANGGYLPYHDKSDPQAIYDFFGMSKKTFKMGLGKLYKQKLIELTKTGFKLME